MRTYYVPTKCGRCIECRQQRQREWIVRLSEELTAIEERLNFKFNEAV